MAENTVNGSMGPGYFTPLTGVKNPTYNWAKGAHPCRSPYQPDFSPIQR